MMVNLFGGYLDFYINGNWLQNKRVTLKKLDEKKKDEKEVVQDNKKKVQRQGYHLFIRF